jgi:hypothetical protein
VNGSTYYDTCRPTWQSPLKAYDSGSCTDTAVTDAETKSKRSAANHAPQAAWLNQRLT